MGNASVSGNSYISVTGSDTALPQLTAATGPTVNYTSQGAVSVTANVPYVMCNTLTGVGGPAITGPGVIKKIWCVGTNSPGPMRDGHLQIYIDGESLPSLDLELGALGFFGVNQTPVTPWAASTPNLMIAVGNNQ